MFEWTMGAIYLGPNGNHQAGHWFMSLTTGPGSCATDGPGYQCHERSSSM